MYSEVLTLYIYILYLNIYIISLNEHHLTWQFDSTNNYDSYVVGKFCDISINDIE